MAKTWYPVIDRDKCTECLECVNFCPHGVYAVIDGKPVVVNPDNCVEFCKGCSKICPSEAIHYEGSSAGAKERPGSSGAAGKSAAS
ncbi:MAG: ferredoxin family protein [Firmicutes bacterium]|nr:ferredoxin family protein [Bacillota bacterium]